MSQMGIVPKRQDPILPRYRASAGFASALLFHPFGSGASVPKQKLRHYTSARSFSALESILARLDSNFSYDVFELNRPLFQAFGTEARPSAQPLGTARPCLSSSFFSGACFGTNPPASAVALVGHFLCFCRLFRSWFFLLHFLLGRGMLEQLVGPSLSQTS